MRRGLEIIKIAVVAVILLFTVCAQAGELRISVAKSMTDLFKDLAATFEAEQPDVKIIPNFASSGALAKQIAQGAPADFYVSANPKWMNYLVEEKKIDTTTRKTFAHNSLVFVGMKENGVAALEDLPKLSRIGLGSPKSVPAGQYARDALEKAGLWQILLDQGTLVMAKDVRQALIYADRGETGGSFVYKTDAMLARNAIVLFEVPHQLYNEVSYPVAITMKGKEKPEAREFYDYVTSESAHEKLAKYGFGLPR